MFIGIVKTQNNEEYKIESHNFIYAWNFIHATASELHAKITYASILEDKDYPHKSLYNPKFKEIAAMRIIK